MEEIMRMRKFIMLVINSQPWVLLERKCICLSSVANNFYQFGLLDFNHIQVSIIAYNFCYTAKLIRTTIGQILKGNKIAP